MTTRRTTRQASRQAQSITPDLERPVSSPTQPLRTPAAAAVGPGRPGPAVPLADLAERITAALRQHFGADREAERQVLALGEEVGEFLGAYRRWAGLARRTGPWTDVCAELADVAITAYVVAAHLGIDLDAAIDAKTAVIFARPWKDRQVVAVWPGERHNRCRRVDARPPGRADRGRRGHVRDSGRPALPADSHPRRLGMTGGTQPSRPAAGGRRRYVDRWIGVTSKHQVGVPDSWPEELPLPPAGASEQTWSTTIAAGCRAEHDRTAAEHAIAAAARHLGLLVGERPHVLEDPEVLPDGRRRYRVRVLVTRPEDWTPPGRSRQLPLWDTGQTAAQARDGAA